MSKQYLTAAAHDNVHPAPVFAVASAGDVLVSGSGASSLKAHLTTSSSFPPVQTLSDAHKLGCHHIAASRDGTRVVTSGFAGETCVWSVTAPSPTSTTASQDATATDERREAAKQQTVLKLEGTLVTDASPAKKPWALALSSDGHHLAATTMKGHIQIFDLSGPTATEWKQAASHETKGSFGLCVDISSDDTLTASGHHSGAIYVFVNETGRLLHSLAGLAAKPVRRVRFSPAGTLLAACGDARTVALYDAKHGEQVAVLQGHQSWVMALDWSGDSGEYIVSGDYGGTVRVWSTDTKDCVSVLKMDEDQGAIWDLTWLKGRASARTVDGFVVATESGGLKFLREAAGG